MPPKNAAAAATAATKPAAKTTAKPVAAVKKAAADRPLSPSSRAKMPSIVVVGAAPVVPPGVPVDMGAAVSGTNNKSARVKPAAKPVPKTGGGIAKLSAAQAAARAKRAAAPELLRGGRIRLRALGHGIISMTDSAVELIQRTVNRLLADKVDKCVIIVSESQRGIIAERDVLMAHRLSSGEELYSACDEKPIYSLSEINGAVEHARNPKLALRKKREKRALELAAIQSEHLKSVRAAGNVAV